ncbi:MAG: DNA-processing protein DprA [Oscillospiraceae bacterium]|nr:DNA-processing protein DprA [Oscillospiraceae bacterium]
MEDLVYWVWLNQAIEVGRTQAIDVLAEHGEGLPQVLFEKSINNEFCGELFKLKQVSLNKAKSLLKKCNETGCEIITCNSPVYPRCLKHIYAAPPVLYAKGNLSFLNELEESPAICIVGSRKNSAYGEMVTKELTRGLVEAGIMTISGFAVGVDTVVHKETLLSNGKTIAVLGCGIDIDYPQQNIGLKQEILMSNGLFLSEYPPGVAATKINFPVRNRIMAALSDGVLVTEAKLRSGSLITAHRCLEQGKDVFSVPHNINTQGGKGCNKLLKDGATVVTHVNDILISLQTKYSHIKLDLNHEEEKELKSQKELPLLQPLDVSELSDKAIKVLSVLRSAPKELDALVLELKMHLGDLLSSITELELVGAIKTYPGAAYGI